jgi:hypothetical protein
MDFNDHGAYMATLLQRLQWLRLGRANMTTSPIPTDGQPDEQPGNVAFWSGQVSGLKVSNVPSGALNLNVDGKLVNGPLQGFGQMWQKTYRITLSADSLSAKDVIKTWKEHFPDFWPAGNRFFGPLTGIAPLASTGH